VVQAAVNVLSGGRVPVSANVSSKKTIPQRRLNVEVLKYPSNEVHGRPGLGFATVDSAAKKLIRSLCCPDVAVISGRSGY